MPRQEQRGLELTFDEQAFLAWFFVECARRRHEDIDGFDLLAEWKKLTGADLDQQQAIKRFVSIHDEQ